MTPSEIVQRQLDAYDTGDIEAFLATYTDDVEIYDHPSTLRMTGHDAMHSVESSLFASAPNIKPHISQRIEHGNFVVDHETVTGTPSGETKSVIAIYEVRDGLIAKVWFIA